MISLPAPKKHVLVCTNEREQGDCCGKVGGKELCEALKQWVQENNLKGIIRVTRAGCMGHCNPIGATVVIYPEGEWFSEVKREEIAKIKEKLSQ